MNMMKNLSYNSKIILITFWTIISVLYTFSPEPVFAGDNLLMAPSRVIFEGKTRSTTVKLINPSNKPVTFNVEVISTHMDEHGTITNIKTLGENELFAQKMIRFSPRRGTLPPKGVQTIRLMVRKPKDLPSGEYRTHLRCVPTNKNATVSKMNKEQGVGIQVNLVFAISIPIIVRSGEGDVNIIPHTPRLITKDKTHSLEINFERTGLFSSYFDVNVFFIPSGKTERVLIGSNKGLAIYTENKNHIVSVPIKDKELLTKGNIEVEIRNREKSNRPLINSKKFEWK